MVSCLELRFLGLVLHFKFYVNLVDNVRIKQMILSLEQIQ